MDFSHLYEILGLNKVVAVRNFPGMIFTFQPPLSVGVLRCCLWKVKTAGDRIGYFPMHLVQVALQHSIKMNFPENHVSKTWWIHFLGQSKLKCRPRLQTRIGLVMDKL